MQGKGTIRVCTFDSKKAKGDNYLIVGMCHLNNHPYFVLFDCGSSHSFVSIQCLKHISLELFMISLPMVFSTATYSSVEI